MLNRSGTGRDLVVKLVATGVGVTPSPGGGVILTLGEVTARLLPLSTELLLPPRLQETADSDLLATGVVPLVLALPMLLEVGLPRDVPPLITVVE
jgi:hypothetical protein